MDSNHSNMAPSGHSFTVYHDFGTYRGSTELLLLGGYTSNRTTIILYRSPPHGEKGPRDGSMKLFRQSVRRPSEGERLYSEGDDFDRFDSLAFGAKFKLGKRVWTKRHPDDLKKLLMDEILVT